MINEQSVLEHIAEATGKNIRDIAEIVDVQYWKDIVDFTSSETGIDLYADYLQSQGIKEIRIIDSRFHVRIPMSKFQQEYTDSRETAIFCIEGLYARQFRRKYETNFNFIS